MIKTPVGGDDPLSCFYGIHGFAVVDYSPLNENPETGRPIPHLIVKDVQFQQHFLLVIRPRDLYITVNQSKVFIRSKRLFKISTPVDTEIVFYAASNDRTDLPGSKMLDYISFFKDNIFFKNIYFKYEEVIRTGLRLKRIFSVSLKL